MMGQSGIAASIGIDIGASKANIGVLDANGAILAKAKIDIRGLKDDSDATLEAICVETAKVVDGAGIAMDRIGFVGLGVPGTVDPAGGRILYAPNLGWRDVSMEERFRGHFGRTARLVQDARAAALAECLLGAGRGEPVVVCLTLGTGIGAGIILDGKIYNGGFNTSGEVGHMIVQQDGEPCGCGRLGCLEAYASGTAIVRAARKLGRWDGVPGMDKAEAAFDKARAGDVDARGIVERAARYLGIGIVNIVNILSPSVVIISGGMCEQEDLLIRPVRDYVAANAYPLAVASGGFRIVKAALGEDAPMIGAALLYRGL
jgi:glucokinase